MHRIPPPAGFGSSLAPRATPRPFLELCVCARTHTHPCDIASLSLEQNLTDHAWTSSTDRIRHLAGLDDCELTYVHWWSGYILIAPWQPRWQRRCRHWRLYDQAVIPHAPWPSHQKTTQMPMRRGRSWTNMEMKGHGSVGGITSPSGQCK